MAAQQQGLGAGLAGSLGQASASREVSLVAVRDDAMAMTDRLHTLDATAQRLHDHLMGVSDSAKTPGEILRKENQAERPAGMLPLICDVGVYNLRLADAIQERLNQVCHELGEGK
jgi:hypothetical protein